jgi:hypothetical protein
MESSSHESPSESSTDPRCPQYTNVLELMNHIENIRPKLKETPSWKYFRFIQEFESPYLITCGSLENPIRIYLDHIRMWHLKKSNSVIFLSRETKKKMVGNKETGFDFEISDRDPVAVLYFIYSLCDLSRYKNLISSKFTDMSITFETAAIFHEFGGDLFDECWNIVRDIYENTPFTPNGNLCEAFPEFCKAVILYDDYHVKNYLSDYLYYLPQNYLLIPEETRDSFFKYNPNKDEEWVLTNKILWKYNDLQEMENVSIKRLKSSGNVVIHDNEEKNSKSKISAKGKETYKSQERLEPKAKVAPKAKAKAKARGQSPRRDHNSSESSSSDEETD